MEHFSEKNEVGKIIHKDIEYDIKWYQGYIFSTNKLSDDIMDNDTGLPVCEISERIDNVIAYYFDEPDFYGKDGKELYQQYINQ